MKITNLKLLNISMEIRLIKIILWLYTTLSITVQVKRSLQNTSSNTDSFSGVLFDSGQENFLPFLHKNCCLFSNSNYKSRKYYFFITEAMVDPISAGLATT